MLLYAEEEQHNSKWVDLCGRRRLFSSTVIKVFRFKAVCRSAEGKFPPWRNEASQIQFPACWCHRTAEWMEKWMSHRWFRWLITQTSLLPSCRILQEKVSRLARIKARLQCWSRPSLLCPRRALEKMPKVWRFKYLNSLAQTRSLVHEKEGRTEENTIWWHGNVHTWSVCLHSIFNNVLHQLFPNWTWSYDGGAQACWEQWFHRQFTPSGWR